MLLLKEHKSDFVHTGKPLKLHGKWGRDGSRPCKMEVAQQSPHSFLQIELCPVEKVCQEEHSSKSLKAF